MAKRFNITILDDSYLSYCLASCALQNHVVTRSDFVNMMLRYFKDNSVEFDRLISLYVC